MAEYERKFKELSHYSQKFVDTEKGKARRFDVGLRDDLYNEVAVLHLLTYKEILQRAQIIADIKPAREESNANVEKKPWNHNNNNKRKFNEKNAKDKKARQGGVWVEFPTYPVCGKKHGGESYKRLDHTISVARQVTWLEIAYLRRLRKI